MPLASPGEKLDKSEERIRRMFGEISPRYDFLNHVLSGGTDWYWRWRTVRAAPPAGDAPILDVCTGTGDLALAYFHKAGGRAPVVGADFTREMLVIAERKSARSARIPRGEQAAHAESDRSPGPTVTGVNAGISSLAARPIYVQADTQQLPFPDETFQIVSVAFGLRNVTDTARGLREMARVCRPGGRVVILEFSLPGNRAIRAVYLWYFRNVLPRLGQLLMRNRESAYRYLPDSVSQFPAGEGLAALMRECGLRSVEWLPLTAGIATLYIGTK